LSVQELVDRLGEVGEHSRIAALIELGKRDPGDVIPLVDEEVRYSDDYSVLIKKWRIDALPALIEIIKEQIPTEETMMRHHIGKLDNALLGITLIGPDAIDTVPMLLDLMEKLKAIEQSYHYVCRALVAIGNKSPEVLDALMKNFEDEKTIYDNDSTCYALGELAEPGDEEVIAAIIHYIDRAQSVYGGRISYCELYARVALYKLGWEQNENFRIIRDCFYDEDCSSVDSASALARIGNDESISILHECMLENINADNFTAESMMGYISSIGPKPEVKEYLTEVLYLPPMEDDIRLKAMWYLSSFGADSRDVLPIMVDFYSHYVNSTGNVDYMYILMMRDEILRVYEGL
jgi:hypothetical protein